MATGDLRRPGRRERAQIEAAVARVEATTGLQVCVVLGAPDGADLRAHAEATFVETGLVARPAVLVFVAPKQHHVEIVTGPAALDRVPDSAADDAVGAMTARFASGDLVGGLVAGLQRIAEAAGEGIAPEGSVDLPNVVDPEP